MNNYYSRNKRDHSEELAKIEQKRYEDIILNERNQRKLIIGSVRSSVEGKVFKRNNVNNFKSSEEKSKPSSANVPPEGKSLAPITFNPTVEIPSDFTPTCDTPAEVPASKPNNVKKTSRSGIRSTSVFPPILPKIQNNPVPKPSRKGKKIHNKAQDEEIKKLNDELNLLEEEEAFIKASIEKLDFQVYKHKITATLNTIDEETKELEESLANTLKSNEPKSYSPRFMQVGKDDLEVIPEVQGKTNSADKKVPDPKAKPEEKQEPAKTPDSPSKQSDFPGNSTKNGFDNFDSPNTSAFKYKGNYKIPIRSVYSDKSKTSKKLNSDISNKNRIVSRDFVRVNPNINIKNLLYS